MKKLDLLPPELRLQGRPRVSRSVLLALVGVSALFLWQCSDLWRTRARIGGLKKEVEHLRQASVESKTLQQTVSSERASLAALKGRLEARQRALLSARQPAVPLSETLARLIDVLPEEAWITKLNLAEETLRITGASPKTQSAADIVAKLDGSGWFRDTKFVNSQRLTRAGEEVYSFEITTKPVFEKAVP